MGLRCNQRGLFFYAGKQESSGLLFIYNYNKEVRKPPDGVSVFHRPGTFHKIRNALYFFSRPAPLFQAWPIFSPTA